MLTTAVHLRVPANISDLSMCVCTCLDYIYRFCFPGHPKFHKPCSHLELMAFSDPDFCLCFLVKVFPHDCQMLIFLVSCGSSCLCLSLSLSLSTSVCLSLRTCVPECPSGFFRDDKKRCKKCSPLCESCVGSRSDQCSTCRPGLYLVEGANNCVSSCPDGFYLDLGKSIHTSSHSRKPYGTC